VSKLHRHAHGHPDGAVKLSEDQARARLVAHDHGVLCTVHPQRGVDAVPVVYALDDSGHLGVPIDRVKPKSAGRLQRERNLQGDPRALLLVEHWVREDWSRLWWVRAQLRFVPGAPTVATVLAERLAQRYPQYHQRPFERILVLRVLAVSGWSAAG
jgi:PPOX class probable F420-dependent enzyme